ncbi:MAG: hypothetical protein FJ202_10225 [Gemmatimonadetes bacterium]|nr:hypothetical protein [Gemmatimonadota bacterium]
MLRLTKRQQTALGETVRELANYGVAALVFSQFVGGIAVVVWIIIGLDWLGQRRERRSRDRAA